MTHILTLDVCLCAFLKVCVKTQNTRKTENTKTQGVKTMKFSKRPDGLWCGYSTIADSFYELRLDDRELLAEVIRDMAYRIVERYYDLVKYNQGYSFDDVIDEFRYYNDERQTREFWVNYFKRAGCSDEQMSIVNKRLDWLEKDGDLVKE